MLPDRSWQGLWRLVALGILLCYPIMVVKWIPFGGGARYLNVLAAPVCLILLWQAPRDEVRGLLISAVRWGIPFLPFVLIWTFAQLWHDYDPLDLNPPMRLLWCALLFLGARLAGVSYRHLAIVAGLGAVVYCSVALVEVYGLGRKRAWGGTYENRFGQFSIWVASLCFLHVFLEKAKGESRSLSALLLLAGMLGCISTWLSGSRGALLALLVLIAIALFSSTNRRRGLLFAIALTSVVLAFCLLDAPTYQRLELTLGQTKDYFSEAEFSPTSVGIRLELYRIAFLTFLDHPVIGPGYTSLEQLYETHPALGVARPEMLEIPGFHNDWSETIGIGGGLLLVSLFGTCLWMARSARRNVYQLAFLGFAVIFSFSEIFFTNKMGLSLLMASWALYAAAEQNQEQSA
ncbi:O-antigen ligase family protein [Ferribacterium limneticum]|uniref:O-antigen ligase family protein n=1 Tax=Ferribacterium limneticum TaxID=76259 RepID=UPI001CFA563E|nr:O-antigen ligase family protein [Ferribacterium limneticum]UCV19175.1 O-antigen ligase family protein [Ferribacterium limneticum]